jgi:hypothetical protein
MRELNKQEHKSPVRVRAYPILKSILPPHFKLINFYILTNAMVISPCNLLLQGWSVMALDVRCAREGTVPEVRKNKRAKVELGDMTRHYGMSRATSSFEKDPAGCDQQIIRVTQTPTSFFRSSPHTSHPSSSPHPKKHTQHPHKRHKHPQI